METSPADVRRQLEGLRSEIADLRASRTRLVLADDAERRNLERALHDGVQQALVGLAAGVELAARAVDKDPAAAKELLAEVGRDVLHTLEDARELAHRIYPPLLEAGGLIAALRSAAASIGVPIRIAMTTNTDLPPQIAGIVYFCCLDVLEHADAGMPVTIAVRNEGNDLAFEVVAARELDAGGPPLRDRVEALGGRLIRSSGPDHGTRLLGSLPLPG